MIKCLSQKTTKMRSKKICTNKKCINKEVCTHSKSHNELDSCSRVCSLTENSCKCVDEIYFLRKQKLEKLNQNYEI